MSKSKVVRKTREFWNKEKSNIQKDLEDRISLEAIGAGYNVSRQRMHQVCRQLNLTTNTTTKYVQGVASAKHPLYSTWVGMRSRCYDPSNVSFKYYGTKGVTVCKRWRDSFKLFVEDMGDRPIGYSLDRINSSGNYELSNCRWADIKTQNNNKR